jgi:hypothetical protein
LRQDHLALAADAAATADDVSDAVALLAELRRAHAGLRATADAAACQASALESWRLEQARVAAAGCTGRR